MQGGHKGTASRTARKGTLLRLRQGSLGTYPFPQCKCGEAGVARLYKHQNTSVRIYKPTWIEPIFTAERKKLYFRFFPSSHVLPRTTVPRDKIAGPRYTHLHDVFTPVAEAGGRRTGVLLGNGRGRGWRWGGGEERGVVGVGPLYNH